MPSPPSKKPWHNQSKGTIVTKDESHLPVEEQSIVFRLQKRAEIRRQIPNRKSVQEGSNDRIADLLEEAARIPSDIIDILKNDHSIRHHGMTTFTRDVIDAAMAKAIKLIKEKYNV